MRFLLTGGFGYLGGRLAQHLGEQGFDVVLGSQHTRQAPQWLPDAKIAKTCWSDAAGLEAACSDMDVVVHLAGMNALDCGTDPVAALQLNGVATAQLVEAAIAARVPRLIYLSTAHVYAAPLIGSITENTCPTNLHPYATSHRAGEDPVVAAARAGRICGIVLRLSNAFGAPADANANCWMLVVNDLARQGVRTGTMRLSSSGTQKRDFIPIREVCRVITELAQLPGERLKDDLFNLGLGTSMSVAEMAERVAERFRVVTGRSVGCDIPHCDAGPRDTSTLDYRLDRLRATDIALPMPNVINEEIDALIRFCLENAENGDG